MAARHFMSFHLIPGRPQVSAGMQRHFGHERSSDARECQKSQKADDANPHYSYI
jgi:hypothetical protein